MNYPHIIAIVGATCSGKSALALQVARDVDAYIFSIDSVSIYKEIDIVSAKPSKKELDSITHFGINVLYPNEGVSAGVFLSLLHEALEYCYRDSKNLIIVGGSSFYLKSIIEGLSPSPKWDKNTNDIFLSLSRLDIQEQYAFLYSIDSNYAKAIKPSDTYRIQKGLEIYALSGMIPTTFFANNPRIPFKLPIKVFNLVLDRNILHDNIAKRTLNMIECGILQEARYLIATYGRDIRVLKSIGLKECVEFIDNADFDLALRITKRTKQFAKRQITFNKTQFNDIVTIDANSIDTIIDYFKHVANK